MLHKNFASLFITLAILVASCSEPKKQKLVIAITKTTPVSNYTKWLKRINPDITILNFYNTSYDSLEILLKDCDGLLVTGGNDVFPQIYGKQLQINKCEDFDRRRDSLEIKLIQLAIQKKMPLFGICRGEQILNVTNGGSLFTDIPMDIGTSVIHRIVDSTVYHEVVFKDGSLLKQICGVSGGKVNSIHHQCIDKVAPAFMAVANSPDGAVEAIELKDKSRQFVMGVQWHPERLDSNNVLSKPLGEYFLKRVAEYNLSK